MWTEIPTRIFKFISARITGLQNYPLKIRHNPPLLLLLLPLEPRTSRITNVTISLMDDNHLRLGACFIWKMKHSIPHLLVFRFFEAQYDAA